MESTGRSYFLATAAVFVTLIIAHFWLATYGTACTVALVSALFLIFHAIFIMDSVNEQLNCAFRRKNLDSLESAGALVGFFELLRVAAWCTWAIAMLIALGL